MISQIHEISHEIRTGRCGDLHGTRMWQLHKLGRTVTKSTINESIKWLTQEFVGIIYNNLLEGITFDGFADSMIHVIPSPVPYETPPKNRGGLVGVESTYLGPYGVFDIRGMATAYLGVNPR